MKPPMRTLLSFSSLFMATLPIAAATACSGGAPLGEVEDRTAQGISTDDDGPNPPPTKPLVPVIGTPGHSYTVPDCPPGMAMYQDELVVFHEPGTGTPYNVCEVVPGTTCNWTVGDPVPSACEDEVPAASWPVFGPPNVTAIALGAHTTYALGGSPFAEASDTRAAVYSWGLNADYELGNGTTTNASTPVVTLWVQGNAVKAIAAGDEDACAQMSDGSVECWGTIATLPSPVVEKTPTKIAFPSGTTVTQIVHGQNHACALANAGTEVFCWGNNDKEQLGDATSAAGRAAPFKVNLGSKTIVTIAAGGRATCALDTTGATWCWGDNERGSLGNARAVIAPAPGSATDYTATPQQVVSPGEFVAFATSSYTGYPTLLGGGAGTFCAEAADLSGWYCWGANDQGQAGVSLSGVPITIDLPAPILTGPGVSQAPYIAIGTNHSCIGGVSVGNTAVPECYGANQSGQLGTGSTSTTPVTQPESVIATQLYDNVPALLPTIAVGENHSCALLTPSAFEQMPNLVCWGAYESGELSMPQWTKNAAGAYVAPTPLEPSYMAWNIASLGQWGE